MKCGQLEVSKTRAGLGADSTQIGVTNEVITTPRAAAPKSWGQGVTPASGYSRSSEGWVELGGRRMVAVGAGFNEDAWTGNLE